MDVSITPATGADLEAVRALLTEAGLPLDGLMEVPTALFVARDDDRVAGAVALERHDGNALLRSLVVAPSRRGEGIGVALVAAAEAEAAREGIGTVHLLTETAEGFFADRGYRPIDRDGAPEPVMRSVEWAVACADTAVAMAKEVA